MNLFRFSLCLLAALILIPTAAFAHCDGVKHAGNHPHCPGGEPPPPPDPEPSSCPGDFPAFAYSEEKTGKRQRTIRYDLFVANADGSCSIIVHSDEKRSYDDLNFQFDSEAGLYRIAYNHESDDSDGKKAGARPNIRVIDFTVSQQQGETQIDQAFPLVSKQIYRYSGNSSAGRGILGNDLFGGSIVFSQTECFQNGSCIDSINIIEDIDDCIATFGPEPDENCVQPAAFQSSPTPTNLGDAAIFPKWGLSANRIYFYYQGYGAAANDAVIGLIDRTGPESWSSPGAIRDISNDGGDFVHASVALWDYNIGPREVLTATINGALQFIDIDGSCTAAASATSSCLDLGSASVLPITSPAPHGRWTTHTSIDPGPNLLFFENGNISELDPASLTTSVIIGGIRWNTWWWFDPVD